MSDIILRVQFEVGGWEDCGDDAQCVQDFANNLATNLAKIQEFVPELDSLEIVTAPQQEQGAEAYKFGGELIIDQASTLGQYIWMGKPPTEEDDWLGEDGSVVFRAIAIITDRIFCVPFQPIDLEPEEMFGISCAYTLFLIQIVVEEEGEDADTYPFGYVIRNSGGGSGLSS